MKLRNVIYFLVALFVFSNGFSYMEWFSSPARHIVYVLFLGGIIAFVKEWKVVKENDINFRYIIYFTIMPLISVALAVGMYDQTLGEERKIIYFGLTFLSYFTFYLLKLNEKEIVCALTIFGIATLAIQLYQQLDSATILFGYNEDDLESGYFVKRNGIRRFFVGVSNVGLVCLYFYWSKILEKFNICKFLLFVFFVLSIYLYLTRQVLIATGVSLFMSFFIVHKKSIQKKAFVYTIVAFIMGLLIYDIAFADFVTYSQTNTYSMDVRLSAIPFFFSKWFDSFFSLLLGHGRLNAEVQWGYIGLNASDIGFIGEAFTFGVVWILVYFGLVLKFLLSYRRLIPPYLIFFLFGTFINSIFIFPYKNSASGFIWAAFLYIANCYISPKIIHSKDNNVYYGK